MARIIIELRHPAHLLPPQYVAVEGESITVGRGYDNAVIVPDAYVSARHLCITLRETGWEVQDVGTENGTLFRGVCFRGQVFTAASGEEILIGRTTVKIHLSADSVCPARRLAGGSAERDIPAPLCRPLVLPGLSAIAGLGMLNRAFYGVSEKLVWSKVFSQAVGLFVNYLLAALIAAGFWALIGRLAVHRACFRRHYTIAVLSGVLYAGVVLALDYAEFLLDSSLTIAWVVATAAMVACFLYWHLSLSTPLSDKRKWMLIIGALCVVLLSAATAYVTFSDDLLKMRPYYDNSVYPPFFPFPSGKPLNLFLAEITR
ncbi:MAG: FHA domain-containing protein [Candidatus Omnitrophica bacterium]|nr:FHA domain-containing protein [Candidatus Omnitrophota bacterium]